MQIHLSSNLKRCPSPSRPLTRNGRIVKSISGVIQRKLAGVEARTSTREANLATTLQRLETCYPTKRQTFPPSWAKLRRSGPKSRKVKTRRTNRETTMTATLTTRSTERSDAKSKSNGHTPKQVLASEVRAQTKGRNRH